MERIENDFDQVELARIAAEHNIKLAWRRARCEHGNTREQFCNRCDLGYVYDTHSFANCEPAVVDGTQYAAVADGGSEVCYIPARFERRLAR